MYAHFQDSGHDIVRLKRGHPSCSNQTVVFYDPDKGTFFKELLEGFDVAIHLAGESIFGRWTREKKRRILESRIRGTGLLAHVLAQTVQPPRIFLSASAIGYYGDRGEEEVTEDSSAGRGFLPSVCCAWEKATQAIGERGTRIVNARFAPVLGKGGLLQALVLPFRLGLGGRLGSGEQWMSWIFLNDLIRAIDCCLQTESMKGPVNVTSPHPVRQKEFAALLAKTLHRPAIFHQPAWLLRMILGEMATEVLLSSTKAVPKKLLEAGFSFQVPEIETALSKACYFFRSKRVL